MDPCPAVSVACDGALAPPQSTQDPIIHQDNRTKPMPEAVSQQGTVPVMGPSCPLRVRRTRSYISTTEQNQCQKL
eukprot:1157917-Pelagomonas_calceolata.AAC.5